MSKSINMLKDREQMVQKEQKEQKERERSKALLKEEIELLHKQVIPEINNIKVELEQKIKPERLQTFEGGFYVGLVEEITNNIKRLESSDALSFELKNEYVKKIRKNLDDLRAFSKKIINQQRAESFKLDLIDYFNSSQSKIHMEDYIYKTIRILISIIAIKIASSYSETQYVTNVIGNDELPPSLAYFVGLAIILDFAMNICFFIVINLLSMKNRAIKELFEDNKTILFYDYMGSLITFTLCGYLISTVIENKKYFRYREDGSRGIRGFETILIYLITVLHLVPYSMIVHSLMSSSKPEALLEKVLDNINKVNIYNNKLSTIQTHSISASSKTLEIKSLLEQLKLKFNEYNTGMREGIKKISKDATIEYLSKDMEKRKEELTQIITNLKNYKKHIEGLKYNGTSSAMGNDTDKFLESVGINVDVNFKEGINGLYTLLNDSKTEIASNVKKDDIINEYTKIVTEVIKEKLIGKNQENPVSAIQEKLKESEYLKDNTSIKKLNGEDKKEDIIKKIQSKINPDIQATFDKAKKDLLGNVDSKKSDFESELTNIKNYALNKQKSLLDSYGRTKYRIGGDSYKLTGNANQNAAKMMADNRKENIDLIDKTLINIMKLMETIQYITRESVMI
jgi:hypothetical protein